MLCEFWYLVRKLWMQSDVYSARRKLKERFYLTL